MNSNSDAELVGLARSDHKEAFGELADRHLPLAEHVALLVVGQKHVAQELAQEAILQAYLSLERLRNDERFVSWLYGIVLNVSRSYIRDERIDFLSLDRMSRESRPEVTHLASEEPDPEAAIEADELHDAVLRAVESLSEKNRAAILLYYYEDLGIREISELLGISAAAVKGRLHKSRNQLRPQLTTARLEFSRTEAGEPDTSKIAEWQRVARVADKKSRRIRTPKRRSNMAEVVSSQLPTCPSCKMQAVVRIWSCGCQASDPRKHLESCQMPDYFDGFLRLCQEMQAHGPNPQVHLRLVNGE